MNTTEKENINIAESAADAAAEKTAESAADAAAEKEKSADSLADMMAGTKEKIDEIKKKRKRVRRGLTFKALVMIVLITIMIGVLVAVVGLYMFRSTILYEIRSHTCTLAQAIVATLDEDTLNAKTEEVLDIYEQLPDEVKNGEQDQDYKENFEPVLDDTFRSLQRQMWTMQHDLGLRNSFIVAMDEETDRMIYLIDADLRRNSFCYPGTYDVYTHEEVEVLVHGEKADALQRRLGLKNDYQATITNLKQFGYRCTGGQTLYEKDGYTVILCLDETLDHLELLTRMYETRFGGILILVILVTAGIAFLLIRRVVTKPLSQMADAARNYNADKLAGIATPDRFSKLKIRNHDEIGELSNAMKEMEQGLIEYEENLKQVTAESERINTELNLATRIQMDMLPSVFPPFPERDEFDIFASMDPAKEVGGDFYDFFIKDEDHLAFLIADVSGKGVPAALFMMVSKTILDNTLNDHESPAKALEVANNLITANNKEEMFVTVWAGIMEISTGRIRAANAGHERPVIIKDDGRVEVIQDKHGFVIGGMTGMKYKEYELTLDPGDKIFTYTDGVAEATDANEELFGEDRMVRALRYDPSAKPKEVLKNVRAAVDEFVGEAEQFDDLTMLCLERKKHGD